MSLAARAVAPLLLIASFSNAVMAQDNIQDVAVNLLDSEPSVMIDNYLAQYPCNDEKVMSGEVGPTRDGRFNQMWNFYMCEEYEGAGDVLSQLPMVEGPMDENGFIAVPSSNDTSFNECYLSYMPFDKKVPIERTRDIFDEAAEGGYSIQYGPFSWPAESYKPLHDAITAQCAPSV